MRSRLLAASAALLLLPACQSEGPPTGSDGASSSAPSPAPSTSSEAAHLSPRATVKAALRTLEKQDRGAYGLRVLSDGAASIDARGSFELSRSADLVRVRILDPKAMEGFGLEDIEIGDQHFVQAPGLMGDGLEGCFLQVGSGTETQVDLRGFHADPLGLVGSVDIAGFSRGSDEVIRGSLRLSRLASLVAFAEPEARAELAASDAVVPIEITVVDGELRRWTVAEADLRPEVRREVKVGPDTTLFIGDVEYAAASAEPEEIQAPPEREVTTDPQVACAAGGSAA